MFDRALPPESGLPAMRERLSIVRTEMLGAPETLADFGKFSAAQVAKIRAGRGLPDAANDASVLATLFRDNWAGVQGMTAVTKELVEEAGSLGAKITAIVKPGQGRGAVADTDLGKLRDERNRLWTLFATAHSELSVGAYWKWREDYRRFVPSLLSRKA